MTTSKIQKRIVSRGGKRDGAGRPPGSGRYGEPTKAIRVPQSLVSSIQQILATENPKVHLSSSSNSKLPLYEHKIAAGFLSPADDHIETYLDLNEHLIKNPASTFCVRVEGESMLGAGIHPNDLLIVDHDIPPQSGDIIIAAVNTELTVKRLAIDSTNKITLHPENDSFPVIPIQEGMHFHILGVVTNVIHAL